MLAVTAASQEKRGAAPAEVTSAVLQPGFSDTLKPGAHHVTVLTDDKLLRWPFPRSGQLFPDIPWGNVSFEN